MQKRQSHLGDLDNTCKTFFIGRERKTKASFFLLVLHRRRERDRNLDADLEINNANRQVEVYRCLLQVFTSRLRLLKPAIVALAA